MAPPRHRREDHRIHRELAEALRLHPNGDYHCVAVEVRHAAVILRGEVPTFQHLWSLEALAAETPGVRHVRNRVVVSPERLRVLPPSAVEVPEPHHPSLHEGRGYFL